jgi:uncharacterized protein (TIGR02996 family)/excisionase family DNA binding protein
MNLDDEAGLLRAITQEPRSDLPRRIYADWLEDHGRGERAEFIRLQLDLAQSPSTADRQREQELLSAYGAGWLEAELPGWALRPSAAWMTREECKGNERLAAFRRGMVEMLFLPLDDFLEEAHELAERLPTLSRVQLTDRRPRPGPEGMHDWSDVIGDAGRDFHLPAHLAGCLPPATTEGGGVLAYRSEDEALAALSRGCVTYTRPAARVAARRVFTTGQVAKIVQVSPATVGKWFDSGRLRGYRIPGSQDRRIPRENLIRFLRQYSMSLEGLAGEWEEEDLREGYGVEEVAEPPPAPAPAPTPSSLERWAERMRRRRLALRDKEVFTTGEVATLCQVAPRTVVKWFDAGKLGGYRVSGGKQRRVPRADLLRFLEDNGMPSLDEAAADA